VEDQNTIAEYFRSGMNFFYFEACNGIKHAMNSNGLDWARTLLYWNYRIKARSPQAISAPFLSNHDQDRSFYNIGGEPGNWDSRPVPTTQGNDRRRFAASLLLLSPGTPYIYYGEEIGLTNNYVDYWSTGMQNNNYEYNGQYYEDYWDMVYKRATDDSDRRGPMWWSNTNRTGTANPPENRQWSFDGLASRYGNGVGEQLIDDYSLLRHYIRVGNLKSRYPFIAWGSMDIIDTSQPPTSNSSICAYRITDTWKQSSTYGKSVIVAHNTNYASNQIFTLPTEPLFIDCICARDYKWTHTLTGLALELPPYGSAIIGEN
jgi:glycosidase